MGRRAAVQEVREVAPADDPGVLFRAYRATRATALHGRLPTFFMPLVHQVARRYGRSGIPTDDLHQIGYIGLMNAVSNFDPGRSVKFETYARHLIAGEIRHYMRDQGTTVRRPRWLDEIDHRVARAMTECTHRISRTPTAPGVAR